jgi:heat shock protein HslJ
MALRALQAAAVAACLAVALAEGAPSLPDASPPDLSLDALLVLEIGPRTVPCDDVVPRRCFEARRAGESDWSVFDGDLEGYAHRDGHAAVVLAHRPDDPAGDETEGPGGAPLRYVVVQVLAELPLGGARWSLERYGEVADGRDPIPYVDAHFAVTSGGTSIVGSGGCNTFSGPLAIDGEEVRIGPLVTTRRACDADVMEQERLVLETLRRATRVTFYRDAVAFASDDMRVRYGATLVEARLTWTQGPEDPDLQRFAREVDAAAAAGERWTQDPIRVALALIDSRGAPRVDVTRRDDAAEAPRSSHVVVDEDGFLDDSVRGVRSEVVLASMADGTWRVAALTVATRCWRGDRMMVGPGETCP